MSQQQWETLDLEDGTQIQGLNTRDSAAYIGISSTAFQNLLKSYKARGKEIPRYQKGFGRQLYVQKEDLEKLRNARRV